MAYCLITGASAGIGQALAIEYLKRGWDLVLVARRAERLDGLREQCLKLSPTRKVIVLQADVTASDFSEKLQSVLIEVDQLSLVFANAGVGVAGRIDKLTTVDFRRVYETNVLGAIQTVKTCLPWLERSRGRIVLIASMNSYIAFPLGSAYAMSKFALRAVGEALQVELVNRGVSVTIVNPGPVLTEIFTKNNQGMQVEGSDRRLQGLMKRALSGQVAARRIADGVARGRREFTLTFGSALIIWLWRHFPGLMIFVFRRFFARQEAKILSLISDLNPDAV